MCIIIWFWFFFFDLIIFLNTTWNIWSFKNCHKCLSELQKKKDVVKNGEKLMDMLFVTKYSSISIQISQHDWEVKMYYWDHRQLQVFSLVVSSYMMRRGKNGQIDRLYQHWLIQQRSLVLLLQFMVLIIYATHGMLVDEGGKDTESPMFTPQQMCFLFVFPEDSQKSLMTSLAHCDLIKTQ